MEIICSSSALFNPASRDFASRGLVFSKPWRFRSEEVTAAMVGDALLAVMAKSGRGLPILQLEAARANGGRAENASSAKAPNWTSPSTTLRFCPLHRRHTQYASGLRNNDGYDPNGLGQNRWTENNR